jgi:SAM-dependent methyltransferase
LANPWEMPAGSLDRWPQDYERGRPGWPLEAVEVPGLSPAATVLDVGAGTGKLTRRLVSVFDRVVAVEPAEAMRRVLGTLCPQAEVRPGTGQQIPFPDTSADAVFAAEAFHWFDDDRALAEIARVLRPGAALVLMWNLPAEPWEPSISAVERLLRDRVPEGDLDYDPLDLGGPRRGEGDWRGSFAAASFEPLRETRMPNPQVLDREGLVAFFASMGWIADLADQERLRLLAEVRSLLTASEYRRRWETRVQWTRLPPSTPSSG